MVHHRRDPNGTRTAMSANHQRIQMNTIMMLRLPTGEPKIPASRKIQNMIRFGMISIAGKLRSLTSRASHGAFAKRSTRPGRSSCLCGGSGWMTRSSIFSPMMAIVAASALYAGQAHPSLQCRHVVLFILCQLAVQRQQGGILHRPRKGGIEAPRSLFGAQSRLENMPARDVVENHMLCLVEVYRLHDFIHVRLVDGVFLVAIPVPVQPQEDGAMGQLFFPHLVEEAAGLVVVGREKMREGRVALRIPRFDRDRKCQHCLRLQVANGPTHFLTLLCAGRPGARSALRRWRLRCLR